MESHSVLREITRRDPMLVGVVDGVAAVVSRF